LLCTYCIQLPEAILGTLLRGKELSGTYGSDHTLLWSLAFVVNLGNLIVSADLFGGVKPGFPAQSLGDLWSSMYLSLTVDVPGVTQNPALELRVYTFPLGLRERHYLVLIECFIQYYIPVAA
jgi:hypothetical protein